MSRLDDAMGLAPSVAYLTGTSLADGTQVEVVLVELAEQSPAVHVEASLELGVSESRRLVAAEEAYDSVVERVRCRERLRRLVSSSLQLRRRLLATSCFIPSSAAVSSFARAALKRSVAARTWATSSSLSITNLVLFLSE